MKLKKISTNAWNSWLLVLSAVIIFGGISCGSSGGGGGSSCPSGTYQSTCYSGSSNCIPNGNTDCCNGTNCAPPNTVCSGNTCIAPCSCSSGYYCSTCWDINGSPACIPNGNTDCCNGVNCSPSYPVCGSNGLCYTSLQSFRFIPAVPSSSQLYTGSVTRTSSLNDR